MIITAHKVVSDPSIQGLQTKIDALIADDWQPVNGSLKYIDSLYHYEMVQGEVPTGFDDISDAITTLQGRMDDAEAASAATDAGIVTLKSEVNAYCDTQAAKLNLDAGVTDTNYPGITLS